MHALPIVALQDGQPALIDGSLVRLPSELQTKYQINWYAFQAPKGWSRCPQGFAVYVDSDPAGNRFALPGLLIEGEPRPKKWQMYLKPVFYTRAEILTYANSIFAEGARVQKHAEEEVRALIHDLRALSAVIYHNAEDARTACNAAGYTYASSRIESVVASQGMLSLRIDMLSFATDDPANLEREFVPVYRKVHKVVRCFRPNARERGVSISLNGTSEGQTLGPNNYELIPYAIIDNAVKYAPANSNVSVNVEESASRIIVAISSLGPFLEPTEKLKIFEAGYRGVHAIKSKLSGTGIGLSTARRLAGMFEGKIFVEQEAAAQELSGGSYFLTKFTIDVPKSK